eukprot:6198177-Pleurochrysis_carterae.AAC.4
MPLPPRRGEGAAVSLLSGASASSANRTSPTNPQAQTMRSALRCWPRARSTERMRCSCKCVSCGSRFAARSYAFSASSWRPATRNASARRKCAFGQSGRRLTASSASASARAGMRKRKKAKERLLYSAGSFGV